MYAFFIDLAGAPAALPPAQQAAAKSAPAK
jgi:hypothetical protein